MNFRRDQPQLFHDGVHGVGFQINQLQRRGLEILPGGIKREFIQIRTHARK
jgi:hypothetical protein